MEEDSLTNRSLTRNIRYMDRKAPTRIFR
ncbi:hypothetical protein PFDG_05558 [Plasmodium falciparum Dd2]|uniref:Uncharacterized protein n=1 Tax=Plasmodium falciparum (isolate Dd2) TaxID=57267 RepID=A0A0L7M5B5_PLAF4|nr:hypothetical protein PFDG_05558 [Plasmodium falciparum Dd2]